MTITQTLWLRGQAAQRDLFQIASYGAVFAGAATVQTLHLGLTAPKAFWTALGRAAAAPQADPVLPATPAVPDRPAPTAELVQLAAVPEPEAPAVSEPAADDPAQGVASPQLLDHPRAGGADDL